MSAIYQGEVIELTSSDFEILQQELNQEDDFQALEIVDETYLDRLLSRWEEPTQSEKEDMLWEESYRIESDLLESEENYLI